MKTFVKDIWWHLKYTCEPYGSISSESFCKTKENAAGGVKKEFLKNLQYSQQKTCVEVSI